MIYLLGITHRIQYDGMLGPEQKYIDVFTEAVGHMLEDLSIEVVVEEANDDSKKWNRVELTVVERIARAKKIKFIFCEPSLEERKANGILTQPQIIEAHGFSPFGDLSDEEKKIVDQEEIKFFPIREALWFDTIKDDVGSNILCVIGAGHIKSFRTLLEKKGCEVQVIAENWCHENLTGL